MQIANCIKFFLATGHILFWTQINADFRVFFPVKLKRSHNKQRKSVKICVQKSLFKKMSGTKKSYYYRDANKNEIDLVIEKGTQQ
jgi:hypothetical protein